MAVKELNMLQTRPSMALDMGGQQAFVGDCVASPAATKEIVACLFTLCC